MKIKTLLSNYFDYFTIYATNANGDDIVLATHESSEKELKKLWNKKISTIHAEDYTLAIYIK